MVLLITIALYWQNLPKPRYLVKLRTIREAMQNARRNFLPWKVRHIWFTLIPTLNFLITSRLHQILAKKGVTQPPGSCGQYTVPLPLFGRKFFQILLTSFCKKYLCAFVILSHFKLILSIFMDGMLILIIALFYQCMLGEGKYVRWSGRRLIP